MRHDEFLALPRGRRLVDGEYVMEQLSARIFFRAPRAVNGRDEEKLDFSHMLLVNTRVMPPRFSVDEAAAVLAEQYATERDPRATAE